MRARKKADKAATVSDLLAEGVEFLDDGIALFDADLILQHCNAQFSELRGYPKDLLQPGIGLKDLIRYNAARGDFGLGDPDELAAPRLAAIKERGSRVVEAEAGDGRILRINYQWLPSGGLVVSYRDITEQRRAEAALRLSEERHSLVTAAATEGLYDWDIVENTLYVSSRLNQIFGFEEGELTSQDWLARIFPDDKEIYINALLDHFKQRTSVLERDYRIRDKTDRQRWVFDRAIAVRDENDRAIRLVGALSDVTEEKERDFALDAANHEREQILSEFNTVLDHIDYGIMFLDKDLRARYINQAIKDLFGLHDDFIATGPTFLQMMERNRDRGTYQYDEEAWQAFVDERHALICEGGGEIDEVTLADGKILRVQFVSLPDGGRMVHILTSPRSNAWKPSSPSAISVTSGPWRRSTKRSTTGISRTTASFIPRASFAQLA